MYIECKDGRLDGLGRIGWGELSCTTQSYIYNGRHFNKTKSGYKYNCIEEETDVPYWISGPKRGAATGSMAESSKSTKTLVLSIGPRFDVCRSQSI
jgi:hypothetical protein